MGTRENLKTIKVSDHILLKQVELSDAEDIFETIDSQRSYMGKWLPFVAVSLNIENTVFFITKMLEDTHKNYVFVIHYDGVFAGLIGFKGNDKQNKRTEIGYWLSESYQKKGIVTQSVKSLCEIAFDELGMNRIQIRCAVGNLPSKKIPQSLGFVLEGVERDGEKLTGGVYTDLEVYSKLKTD
ncbi:GNAT family N-acetyltransferase [Ancylomarina sp. YFZ004]